MSKPQPPGWRPVLWKDLRPLLAEVELLKKLGETMATQADVDVLAAALQQDDSDLNTAVSGVQAEIAALKAAQPSLDLTGLQTQVTAMRKAVDAAAALVPAPAPAPAPAPEPAPAPAPAAPAGS